MHYKRKRYEYNYPYQRDHFKQYSHPLNPPHEPLLTVAQLAEFLIQHEKFGIFLPATAIQLTKDFNYIYRTHFSPKQVRF